MMAWCFNPRAREGRDGVPLPNLPNLPNCFNPRAREGRDILVEPDSPGGAVFQSTRPRGARRDSQAGNNRTLRVSIHAPARGATG